MKKSKLETVLRRKVRIKITRRKRGSFCVIIPAELDRTQKFSDAAINFWRDRHGLSGRSGSDLRAAFEDARTLEESEYTLHLAEKKNYFPRKKEALSWLFTKLRCIQPLTIRIEEAK